MYQIFKAQIEKSKMVLMGVKRNQRLGREAGVSDSALKNMEEECRRLETLSAELDAILEEGRKKSEDAHRSLEELKVKTNLVKSAIKAKYDQTWWSKFGITDKR